MKKFNLHKKAQYVNVNTRLRADNDRSGFTDEPTNGNINLSMPIKEKDNTVPFNAQLEAQRPEDDATRTLENKLNVEKKSYNQNRKSMEDKTVTPMNMLSEKLHQEKVQTYREAEKETLGDTSFWDKYMARSNTDEKQMVDNNVPNSKLPNHQDRFENVSAKVDAEKVYEESAKKLAGLDAGIFHIYAKAYSEGRELNTGEKQVIQHINEIKMDQLKKIAQATAVDFPQLTPTDTGMDNQVFIVGDADRAEVYEIWPNKEYDLRAVFNKEGTDNVNEARQEFPDAEEYEYLGPSYENMVPYLETVFKKSRSV